MNKKQPKYTVLGHCLFLIYTLFYPMQVHAWGFFAHRQINRYAITTLPPGMFMFYKAHLQYLTEASVYPDKRRSCLRGEAEKHFIDLEAYEEEKEEIRLTRKQPVDHQHGILPWAIVMVQKQLTQAFIDHDLPKILKLSADLGHYIADAHVPLHTTKNYNGQFTHQEGIHALWETRLPKLFFQHYNLFVGKAYYINDPFSHICTVIHDSHRLVADLLSIEKQISRQYPALLKYSFEQTGKVLKKEYAVDFAQAYHLALKGQVEQRLQQSILQVGNFWMTSWINAGSPNLDQYTSNQPIVHKDDEAIENMKDCLAKARTCPKLT